MLTLFYVAMVVSLGCISVLRTSMSLGYSRLFHWRHFHRAIVWLSLSTKYPQRIWVNKLVHKRYKHKKGEPWPSVSSHDDVIKWKHFPRYWPFVREINRSPVNYPHKGQWCGALVFSLFCGWINGWVNNREAGDLRRHRAHYDVTLMGYSAPSYHHLCLS